MTKEDCRVAGREERWGEDADLSLNFNGNRKVDRDLKFIFVSCIMLLLAHILSSQENS